MSGEAEQAKGCRSNKRNLVLSFALPFLVIAGVSTAIDYCDISDGIERERDIGIKHTVTDQQILLNSFKKSLLLAFPAGLIGLVVGAVCFRKTEQTDTSVQKS